MCLPDQDVRPGLMICYECGGLMRINDDLTVRGMTEQEMDRSATMP